MMNKSPIQRYLEACKMTDDPNLRWWYQKQMIQDEINEDKKIDEIADRVIERIKVNFDASEIIGAIEEIKRLLEELGGK